ncbi:MAG: hypothetical protein Q9197_001830 [Variospora fuerteventurae]
MASSIYALRVKPVAFLALSLLITVSTVMLLSTPSPFGEKINDSLHTATDIFYASVISSYGATRLCVLDKAHCCESVMMHTRERIVQVSKSSTFVVGQILLSRLPIGTIATLLFLRLVISCFAAIFFVIDAAWSDPRQSWQRKCSFVITAILFGIFPYGHTSAVATAVRVVSAGL